jgi:hypothetical protein
MRRAPSPILGSLLAIAACALSLAGAGGCFFSPRDPQVAVPFDSTTTRWRQPNDAGTLVRNVKVTFEDRQITFYERSFRPETFQFIADPQDVIDFAAQQQFPFVDYGLEQEKRVASTIFNNAQVDRIVVEYGDTLVKEMGSDAVSDTARWQIEYDLLLMDSVSEESEDTTRYAGVLTFYMRDFAGEWRLYAWVDNRSAEPDVKTWGTLRGENLN